MSKTPPSSGSAFDPKAWIVPGVVTCVLVAAVVSYPRAAEINAAAGSPYYSKAAQEALAGLRSSGEKQALPAANPALPAGLSPDEHYWCEQCKAYHKRQPGQSQPAGVAPAPIAGGEAAADQTIDAIPPLPEGQSANDYYWCVNCKAYHPRQAAKSAAAWAGVPYKLPEQPGPTLPP